MRSRGISCVCPRSLYRTDETGPRVADERERTHAIPSDPMGRRGSGPDLSIGLLNLA